MRVAVAMMTHETNTFSPLVTDLARFSGSGGVPPEGEQAYRMFRGTASCLGGFIEVCEAVGAEVFIPIAAGAARYSRGRARAAHGRVARHACQRD
jgi:microcystin degradation protein MlrC